MADYQSTFRRVEMKYVMSPEQKRAVLDVLDGRMAVDS